MSPANRQSRPHLRCGMCDEEFSEGDDTTYVDDERVHVTCAMGETLDRHFFALYCPACGVKLDDVDYDDGACQNCGKDFT